nr:MAG TPA: hypothetical protein [Caudoviricetes sp.]
MQKNTTVPRVRNPWDKRGKSRFMGKRAEARNSQKKPRTQPGQENQKQTLASTTSSAALRAVKLCSGMEADTVPASSSSSAV